jgi:hypothetical protein
MLSGVPVRPGDEKSQQSMKKAWHNTLKWEVSTL